MGWRFPKIPLLFATILILTLGALPGAAQSPPFTLSSPIAYELTHVINVSNRGPGAVTRLDLEVAIPVDVPPYQYARFRGAQGVEKSQITEKTDDEGNTLLMFHLKEIPAGQSTQIKLRYLVQVYAVAYDLSPARPTRSPESSLRRYTAPEKYVESDDPAIVAKAMEVAGRFTDPVQKARAIYAYVGKALTFKLNVNKIDGAAAALRSGQGDCTEFTTLAVALLRASGVPARVLLGYTAGAQDTPFHDWLEFYVPDRGWVPMDPTWGRHGADYFGRMDNRHVVKKRGFLPLGDKVYEGFVYWWSGEKPDISDEISFRPETLWHSLPASTTASIAV